MIQEQPVDFNKEKAIKEIKNDPNSYLLLTTEQKANKDIRETMMEKVSAHLNSKYYSSRLELELLKYVLEMDGSLLEKMGDDVKNNIELVKIAINNNPFAIDDASDELKNNEDLAFLAVTKDAKTFLYIGNELKNNEDLAFLAVTKDADTFLYIGEKLKANKHFVIRVLEKDSNLYKDINDNFKKDPTIFNEILHFQNQITVDSLISQFKAHLSKEPGLYDEFCEIFFTLYPDSWKKAHSSKKPALYYEFFGNFLKLYPDSWTKETQSPFGEEWTETPMMIKSFLLKINNDLYDTKWSNIGNAIDLSKKVPDTIMQLREIFPKKETILTVESIDSMVKLIDEATSTTTKNNIKTGINFFSQEFGRNTETQLYYETLKQHLQNIKPKIQQIYKEKGEKLELFQNPA